MMYTENIRTLLIASGETCIKIAKEGQAKDTPTYNIDNKKYETAAKVRDAVIAMARDSLNKI